MPDPAVDETRLITVDGKPLATVLADAAVRFVTAVLDPSVAHGDDPGRLVDHTPKEG